MDNLYLQNQIDELKKEIQNLKSPNTIPLEIEKALLLKGFIAAETEEGSPIIMNGTCNISISSPCIISSVVPEFHNLFPGQRIQFSTTGALPTGLSTGTDYYVLADGFSRTSFKVSTTMNGSPVNTSGTQSGVQTYDDPYIVWELNATAWALVKGRGSNLNYYLPLYTIGQF